MSLKKLLKKLKRAFPNLQALCLIIEDDSIENESPRDILDLIVTPQIDSTLDLKVVFNFTVVSSDWKHVSNYSIN